MTMAKSNSPVPRYHQIYLILRQQIASGIFDQSGLPPELRLVEQYQVARVTMRRALSELVKEGLVYRRAGHGTFVNKDHASRSPGVARAWRLADGLLEDHGETMIRLIDYGMLPCPPEVAELLGVPPLQAVLRIVRVRSLEGRPVSCVTMYIPPEMAPLFSPQAITETSGLALLERGGVRISQADQSISSCLADAHVAPLLDEPMGAALLSVLRVVRDNDGRPVQWLRGLYRPHYYDHRMVLARAGADNARTWIPRDITCAVR
ncbi:GntR family transcriptional regulator [Cupriavidus sp. P-10]|uniref:GntR family transcriptional regulator n=1 Tax=Cupriavidus sp. P-10 TaxID=2027911 RepID=UPI000EDEB761|nr:GntR family transcriptional regulator [Cupriavidus sp. P-10]BDB27632.1 GntR family transcriptional regulator [Cupriavidus sp. P-10]